MSQTVNAAITVVGIDIGKNSFLLATMSVARLCCVRSGRVATVREAAMSATIIPYLRGYSFDPEITKAMGTAYDREGVSAIASTVLASKAKEAS